MWDKAGLQLASQMCVFSSSTVFAKDKALQTELLFSGQSSTLRRNLSVQSNIMLKKKKVQ